LVLAVLFLWSIHHVRATGSVLAAQLSWVLVVGIAHVLLGLGIHVVMVGRTPRLLGDVAVPRRAALAVGALVILASLVVVTIWYLEVLGH